MTAAGVAIGAFAGFIALALAMARHHAQVFLARSLPPARRQVLRCAGWGLLAASGVQSVLAWGWGEGAILWCGMLSATSLAGALGICYAPRATATTAALLLGLAALRLVVP